MSSIKTTLFSGLGICRIASFLLSLVAFACMADFTFYKAHSDWEYNLAINIIAWLYAAAMLAVMLFRSKVDTFCGYTPIVMLILDVIMTILVLIGGIATVARCNTQGIYKGLCNNDQSSIASAAFTFFNVLALIGCVIYSNRLRAEGGSSSFKPAVEEQV